MIIITVIRIVAMVSTIMNNGIIMTVTHEDHDDYTDVETGYFGFEYI